MVLSDRALATSDRLSIVTMSPSERFRWNVSSKVTVSQT